MKIKIFDLRRIIRETIASLHREDAILPGKYGGGGGKVPQSDVERLSNRGDTSIFTSDELVDDVEDDEEDK